MKNHFECRKQKMHQLLEKIQGSLIGKWVGDALGFLVEGNGHAYCTDYVKKFLENNRVPRK